MATSSGVDVEHVTKRFGSLTAIDDLSLAVQPGEFFSLLGPSGCGKTTLLRIIAGFEKPDQGAILLDGRDVTQETARSRPTVMVFQNFALFPTMTVAENVSYGLRIRRKPRAEIKQRLTEALKRVELDGLENKPVTELSGGQQQRVALARALAVEPGVILFDEPLSNLDVALREQTRHELKILQRQIGTTSVYVTHDQQEALALSDRIGVMRSGRLVQIGTPWNLYEAPDTAFVAAFLGGSNVITSVELMARLVPHEACPPGHILSVRPEHIVPVESSTNGAVEARVVSHQFLGAYSEWRLQIGGEVVRMWWAGDFSGNDERIFVSVKKHRWLKQDSLDHAAVQTDLTR